MHSSLFSIFENCLLQGLGSSSSSVAGEFPFLVCHCNTVRSVRWGGWGWWFLVWCSSRTFKSYVYNRVWLVRSRSKWMHTSSCSYHLSVWTGSDMPYWYGLDCKWYRLHLLTMVPSPEISESNPRSSIFVPAFLLILSLSLSWSWSLSLFLSSFFSLSRSLNPTKFELWSFTSPGKHSPSLPNGCFCCLCHALLLFDLKCAHMSARIL